MSAGTLRNVPKCQACRSTKLTVTGAIRAEGSTWAVEVACRDCGVTSWSGHPRFITLVQKGFLPTS